MRSAAHCVLLFLALTACSTPAPAPALDTWQQPNSLMAVEIDRRIEQIPYQHRDELFNNLVWLAQTGEQTIPALLRGLQHENPKVRSSSAWVLGRIGDRRTIPDLQRVAKDPEPTVRLECARTLVMLGDLAWSPALIEGLDSDRKEVRYMCHDVLKSATGHDFGYDHLQESKEQMVLSVLRWRQWWSEYSGDTQFAANYQHQHGLGLQPAAPLGEIKAAVPEVGQPPTANPPQPTPGGDPAPVAPAAVPAAPQRAQIELLPTGGSGGR
jgi:hypothetical protein